MSGNLLKNSSIQIRMRCCHTASVWDREARTSILSRDLECWWFLSWTTKRGTWPMLLWYREYGFVFSVIGTLQSFILSFMSRNLYSWLDLARMVTPLGCTLFPLSRFFPKGFYLERFLRRQRGEINLIIGLVKM